MPRLVTFGCSFTWGSGLPNEIGDTVETYDGPKQYAWPQILAYRLNRECVNLAIPGGSNKAILRRIVEFKYQPDDIAIVMWTVPLRSVIFNEVESLDDDQLHVNMITTPRQRQFYMLHNKFDLEYTDMMFVMAGVNFLKDQNIKTFVNSEIGDFWHLSPKWFKPYRPKVSFRDYDLDLALDNSHPGLKSHKAMARQFLTILSN
jgi:hypothetical protein